MKWREGTCQRCGWRGLVRRSWIRKRHAPDDCARGGLSRLCAGCRVEVVELRARVRG